MEDVDSALERLRKIERDAHARYVRLNMLAMDAALVAAAEQIWKEAAEGVRVHEAGLARKA